MATEDNQFTVNQVIVYHDETKNVPGRNFKGHVLLFVPVKLTAISQTPLFGTSVAEYSSQQMLFDAVESARQKYQCDGKLHFSQLSGRTWKKYDYAYYEAVSSAVDALRHKFQKKFPYPLRCKVAAMFYPKGADWKIYGEHPRKEQKLRHDETLLRMLLKGAAHYLYDERNLIEIKGIIADGESAHRHLDAGRVMWRLSYESNYGRSPLRDYVSFSPMASITHLPSDHKSYGRDSEEYRHATLLQVSDLLLGTIMRACYIGITKVSSLPRIGDTCNKRDVVCWPTREMLTKKERGAGFRNSGHYRSFTLTEVEFSRDGVHFREVTPREFVIQDEESLQLSLFEDDVGA